MAWGSGALGLSMAIGALLAGFMFANTGFSHQLIGDIVFYFALVGFIEELLFRGVIYRACDEWRGARWAIWGSALLFGVLLIIPIGGADMPTVISLLNSYAGLSAVAMGFVMNNKLLITAGAPDGRWR